MNERQLWQLAADHLTPRQWDAFCLRFLDELSYREIGERMGIGERAAARLVDRAMRTIRQAHHEKPPRTEQADEQMAA